MVVFAMEVCFGLSTLFLALYIQYFSVSIRTLHSETWVNTFK